MSKQQAPAKKTAGTTKKAAPAKAAAAKPAAAAAKPEQGQPSVATIIGEVVFLLAQSPQHRNNLLIADMEWYLLPPITAGQVRLFHEKGRPVGFALWARVSEEVEKRLSSGGYKLRQSDWRSGERLWLVDLIAPFGGAEQMLGELGKSALAGQEFRYLKRGPDGKSEVITQAASQA